MNSLWFFLPGIIYLGIITSYTDIRYGKIKNRDVVIGICYAFFVYVALITYFLATGQQLNYRYILELGTNALFAIVVAFGLWNFKLWSAGDGKLFFAFSLLIPLEVYVYAKHNWIPSVTFLFNLFMIGLLGMLILLVRHAKLSQYKKMVGSFFKNFFEPKKMFSLIITIFALFWIVQIFLVLVGLGENILLMYFFMIAALYYTPKFFAKLSEGKPKLKNLNLYVLCTITIIRLVIDKSVYSINFLRDFIAIILIWMTLRRLFSEGMHSLAKVIFSKTVSVNKLKPGMILSDKIVEVKKLRKDEKRKAKEKNIQILRKGKLFYLIGNWQQGNDYLDNAAEGIEQTHIKKIKSLGIKKIRISSTISFAPIIFFAVILTLILKGNILIVLNILF